MTINTQDSFVYSQLDTKPDFMSHLYTTTYVQNKLHINWNPPTCVLNHTLPTRDTSICAAGTWYFWIENFDIRYLYAYGYIMNSDIPTNFNHQRVCIILALYLQLLIYIFYIILTSYMWDWCDSIIYSFVFTSPWGWWFITEICRRVQVYV
jgi:hypothetical protein